MGPPAQQPQPQPQPQPPRPPLSSILPPLICGTGTFNTQYTTSISSIPTNPIIARALHLGIRAFDTSPYYGPSESLLGEALSQPQVQTSYPRESYMILTKCGRIASSSFDYSPAWIRQSVGRSLARLKTQYLDVVYCHDVEFVTPDEVLGAVRELRRMRDEEGWVRYVGISGYPVDVLVELSERIRRETGEPIDIVQSYSNFNLQNTRLTGGGGVDALQAAGVDVVTNASVLSMGLLRRNGVPESGQGDWHPAPKGLRAAVKEVSGVLDARGEKLEAVAIRYAVENWMAVAGNVGSSGRELALGDVVCTEGKPAGSIYAVQQLGRKRLGVSVMGVSKIEELDETMRVWRSVVLTMMAEGGDGLPPDDIRSHDDLDGNWDDVESGRRRRDDVQKQAEEIKRLLGEWYDFTWPSPGEGFVNVKNESIL